MVDKTGGSGSFIGFVIGLVEEIVEYGFVWDVKSSPPVNGPAPVTGPGQTREVTTRDAWTDMQVDKRLALPVPAIYPGQFGANGYNASWHHGNPSKNIFYHSAEGAADYPIALNDAAYPYNGPGAYVGQLLYKFGEKGTPLPVWNEHCCRSIGESGELFLRSNCPDDSLGAHEGSICVDVAYNGAVNKQRVVTVEADKGWHQTGVERNQGWAELWNGIFQTGVFPDSYLAMPVPVIKDRNASWNPNRRALGCGAGGVGTSEAGSVEGDTRYPYSGPGAKLGQLLYKYGEHGTVLPVLSGGYADACNETGGLFMRINDSWDKRGTGYIAVRVS